MVINVIRLIAENHKKNLDIRNIGDNLIEDINNYLIDDDYVLIENAKGASIDAVMIESGGSEELFLKELDNIKTPFILFSTGANNSLAACFEIKTYCFNNKIHCFFALGDDSQIARYITKAVKAIDSYLKISDSNLGVIGGKSPWLIASDIDYKKVKDKFNINLIDIDFKELENEIDKYLLEPFLPNYDEVLKKYKNKEEVDKAYYFYSAIKRIVRKYNLNGLTIKCFDLIDKYKGTACLALSLLNDEGIVSACEGDVASLLTMYLISRCTDRPCFMANISSIDNNFESIILSHCTVPLSLTDNYSIMTHFESGLGIAIRGNMPLQEISVVKIAPSLSNRDFLFFVSKIKENLKLPNFCRTQIRIDFDKDSIGQIMKGNFANHVIVTYSDISEDLVFLLDLFNYFEFEPIE